tara:strand:+ start:414 stop:2867 length:2454 start_codon:yes stop_codon:yes gene_type:complete
MTPLLPTQRSGFDIGKIKVADPLSLLPYQSGLTGDELKEEAAQGNTSLDVRQRACQIGEPIPIVFGRRVTVSGTAIGGVFVAPGATSGSFANDSTTNELTVKLQLVLSQGQIGDIPLTDLYQRSCRVGTWTRAYNRRASNWQPGTTIVNVANKTTWENIPSYCGTDGKYTDMTMLSYTNTAADGDGTWDRQVYAFVKDGLKVTRLLDSQLGSSNNFIDLAIYLIKESKRLPDDMIDTTAMTAAANFLNTNSFLCNGVFKGSENLEDWLTKTGNKFLLRLSEKDGKKCFKSRLPLNANHTINSTGAISPVFGFSEEHILDGSFEIEYIPISERLDACAQVLWRQQPDDDVGIIRTAEVRITGKAANGPFIQYDLSEWCCSEAHAVKFGAYQIAKRKAITHTLRISVRPSTFNSTLTLGDIVRVKLRRETNVGTVDFHDYLYEVERIEKNTAGNVTLDLIHFPVDSNKRSIVAKHVVAATPSNDVLPSGRNDFTCNSNTSDTAIIDDGTDWPYSWTSTFDTDWDMTDDFNEGDLEDDLNNGNDSLDDDHPTGLTDDSGSDPLAVGDSLTASGPACANGRICWYRKDKKTGEKTLINCASSSNGSGSMTLTTADIDHTIIAEWSCPDPGSDDGFGTPEENGESDEVEPDVTDYTYARWTGKMIRFSNQTCVWNGQICDPALANSSTTTTDWTTPWYTFNNYLTISGAYGCFMNTTPASGGNSGTFFHPEQGPVPWRANVRTTQMSGCGGGSLSIGGLGVDGNGGGCSGSTNPFMTFGCVDTGSYWAIEGKWEFSNDTGATKTVAASWGGRSGTNDGSNPE